MTTLSAIEQVHLLIFRLRNLAQKERLVISHSHIPGSWTMERVSLDESGRLIRLICHGRGSQLLDHILAIGVLLLARGRYKLQDLLARDGVSPARNALTLSPIILLTLVASSISFSLVLIEDD